MNIRRTLAAVLLGALATALTPVAADATTHTAAKRRISYCPASWSAHRGENWPTPNSSDSVNAVQDAIDDTSVGSLESDVWVTSDGKGLMQHSNDLAESTPYTGLVSSRTLADIQANVTMDDGSVPQSLPQFLAQVVSAGKHAILHDKSSSLNAYIDAAMRAAGAHPYVRVMVASISEVNYFVGKGWYTEYTPPNRAPTSAEITTAKSAGITAVLIVDTSRNATPSTTIQPWITANVYTDYVTYSAAQDGIIDNYKFNRLLSGDLAASRSVSGCP